MLRTARADAAAARCSNASTGFSCDDTGTIHPQLQALHDNLAGNDRPDTVLSWLNKNTAAAILRELAAGERTCTHAALDELPDSKPIKHLRSVLVATGALPPRDEHMIRLERWITATIAGRGNHSERQLLHRYALWHALRRLRHRALAASTSATARPSPSSGMSGPRSRCWTGSPPATSSWPPPGRVTSTPG